MQVHYDEGSRSTSAPSRALASAELCGRLGDEIDQAAW